MFLALGAIFVWLASVIAVLVTGSFPRGMPFSLEDDPAYPARIVHAYPERVDRWPLVAWLLILPYAIVTAALIQVAVVMAIIAFFAIGFTRSYPVWAFEMVEVAFRWNARSYGYAYFLGTRYPPFAWG